MSLVILLIILIAATLATAFSSASEQFGANGKKMVFMMGRVILKEEQPLCFSGIIYGGEVGVKVIFGSISPSTVKEGINIVNPFAKVVKYSIRLKSYTMSSISTDGSRSGDDSMNARTINNTKVKLDMTVWYRINQAEAFNIYRLIASDEHKLTSIVREVSRSVLRDIVAKYTNFTHLNNSRKVFSEEIKTAMMSKLKDKGLVIIDTLVRNITPPKDVDIAINKKLRRQQEIEEKQYSLKIAEKNKQITIVEAEGIAQAQRIINSTLSYYYLQYLAIKAQEKMSKSPNHTTVYIPSGANGIPMMKRVR